MKTLSLLLALAGLGLGTVIVAWLGAGQVLHALLSVGWTGFLGLAGLQAAVFVLLAVAWCVSCPGIGFGRLLFGRWVREAGMTCLPFSQVGGILFGVRATCGPRRPRDPAPVQWPVAAAATVVDVTTEVLAQIGFVLLGLFFLLDRQPENKLAVPLLAGSVLMALAMAAFIRVQKDTARIFRFLGGHIARQWSTMMLDRVQALQAALDGFYRRPGRLAVAALLHLLGWVAGASFVWLGYRLLGRPVTVAEAVAIEGVTSGVLSVSFLVPASLGVQEAAYAALGAVFGIDPALSLGLSLLRRGRDLALGVPMLLLWQGMEMARLRKARGRVRVEAGG